MAGLTELNLPEADPILVTNSFLRGSLISLIVIEPLGPRPTGSSCRVSFSFCTSVKYACRL